MSSCQGSYTHRSINNGFFSRHEDSLNSLRRMEMNIVNAQRVKKTISTARDYDNETDLMFEANDKPNIKLIPQGNRMKLKYSTKTKAKKDIEKNHFLE